MMRLHSAQCCAWPMYACACTCVCVSAATRQAYTAACTSGVPRTPWPAPAVQESLT